MLAHGVAPNLLDVLLLKEEDDPQLEEGFHPLVVGILLRDVALLLVAVVLLLEERALHQVEEVRGGVTRINLAGGAPEETNPMNNHLGGLVHLHHLINRVLGDPQGWSSVEFYFRLFSQPS